jgi:preprotein translocase subunit SecA
LFQRLLAMMEAEIAGLIFKAAISRTPEAPVETALTRAAKQAATNSGEVEKAAPVRGATSESKIGRNDPCPCGSGLKYKKCGLINAPEHRA